MYYRLYLLVNFFFIACNNFIISLCICILQSQDSASKPTKLVSVVTRVKQGEKEESYQPPAGAQPRPTSDGIMYQNENFNERRIEYEEILLSERTDSQYSQSESYMSER